MTQPLNLTHNAHAEAPANVTGYPLGPIVGFWSLVSAAGAVLNLMDLGLQVLAYTGAGMAPIQNLTTPYALIGGDYYQRTVARPRSIVLMCYTQGKTIVEIQKIRKTLIGYIAPDNSLQLAAQIKLRFATTDNCGNVVGQTLEVPVNYVSGLEGSVDNLYQDRFALQFVEYAPPSIKELTTNSTSLNFQASPVGIRISVRDASGWANFIAAGTPKSFVFDQSGVFWMGLSNLIAKEGGTPFVSANGDVLALAIDQNNLPYAGGIFTSPNPQNRIAYYNGVSWVAVGATINLTVRGLAFDNSGNLYAVGDFTAPGNRAGKWNGSAWSALTGGANLNNTAYCVAKGLDGNIYIGGAFTTADGTTVNGIVRYNVTAGTYSALSSGVAGGGATVYAIAVGPDGRIYIAGDFTSVGGISCNRVAFWNGTAWQPLGVGLNNIVYSIAVGTDNILYAVGAFTAPGNSAYALSSGVAKWNGTTWLPLDIDIQTTTDNKAVAVYSNSNRVILVNNSSSNVLSAVTSITNSGTANAVPTIVFTGPGQLYSVINNTTGKSIYFNYLLLAGETATLNLDPTALSFTSNFFGDVKSRILPGSDLATFSLKPGVNSISTLISGTTSGATSATLTYKNTHWTFDASGV